MCILIQNYYYKIMAPSIATIATTPTLEAAILAALSVGVLLVVDSTLEGDIVVVIETAGELIGAAVIMLPELPD